MRSLADRPLFALGAALGVVLTGCDQLPSAVGGYTYRAEVGYYEGTQQAWYVGRDKSREDCVAEATGLYNQYNAQSKGRAFSWACRQMQGDKFLDRVR
jgi:hypothetical protein